MSPAYIFAGRRGFCRAFGCRAVRAGLSRIWRRYLARRDRSGARCNVPGNRKRRQLDAVALQFAGAVQTFAPFAPNRLRPGLNLPLRGSPAAFPD